MKNKNLHKAKSAKNDEFYTQLKDIEKELVQYKEHFKGKVVYCNCDSKESNFVEYFLLNFKHLGLKKLIATGFSLDDNGMKLAFNGYRENENIYSHGDILIESLNENGDFRSEECIALLEEADIVVTNPPFSLFREYVSQLMEYDKDFLIIGNPNAITYKEVFPLIKVNKLWLGIKSMGTDMLFNVTKQFAKELILTKKEGSAYKIIDEKIKGRAQAVWFTNLEHSKRNEKLILHKKYNPEEYPTYDNYNAINVDKVKDIPVDYKGVMGVPITFLSKFNPKQFEIIKFRKGADNKDLVVNGKCPYFRILIKNKEVVK